MLLSWGPRSHSPSLNPDTGQSCIEATTVAGGGDPLQGEWEVGVPRGDLALQPAVPTLRRSL